MAIQVCCECLVLIVSSVLDICCKYFICMLHMLRRLYTYVASACSKYFSYFRHMFQVFHVSSVYTWMGRPKSRGAHPQAGALLVIYINGRYVCEGCVLEGLFTQNLQNKFEYLDTLSSIYFKRDEVFEWLETSYFRMYLNGWRLHISRQRKCI